MIYFVRHGQTDFNLFHISQGQLDTSLNCTGIKQSKNIAKELKSMNFDVAFCSPLLRAKQTFKEINKYHNLKVVLDARLMEVSKGVLQGNKNKQEVYDKFFANPHEFGGETIEDVYNRIKSFLKDLEQYKGKNILIVGHGGILKYFQFCFANKDIKKDKILLTDMGNCEVTKFEF